MRCVDCEKHSYVVGTHFCDATKKSKRISEVDAYKDVPCRHIKEPKAKLLIKALAIAYAVAGDSYYLNEGLCDDGYLDEDLCVEESEKSNE